jgi:hypothetical protein
MVATRNTSSGRATIILGDSSTLEVDTDNFEEDIADNTARFSVRTLLE